MNWHFARQVGLPKFILRQIRMRLHHRLSRQPLRIHLPTGMMMILPKESFFARDVFVTNADVDWGSESLFCRHLDQGGDFIDAGANIGYYSLYAAPVVRRVFSFDPDPRNYPALEANSRIAGNVVVEKSALSSCEGSMFLQPGAESSVSKIASEPGDACGKPITVKATTLDAFAQSHADLRVTGIKLDTEGHELPILQGGVKMIRRDQPLILTELMRWPPHGMEAYASLAEFAAFLGYRIFAFVPQSSGFLRAGAFRLVAFDSQKAYAENPTKMIFLVPKRLADEFHREAAGGECSIPSMRART